MVIIAVNGQEISLGCFVNLHMKTACVPNGIFAKINKYYVSITHGLLQLMHSNDLRLLVTVIHHLMIIICYLLLILSYITTVMSRILITYKPIAMKLIHIIKEAIENTHTKFEAYS